MRTTRAIMPKPACRPYPQRPEKDACKEETPSLGFCSTRVLSTCLPYPNHPLIDAAARLGIRPIIARGEKTVSNMAPVLTTMAAKSAFPEDHPLSIGPAGHTIAGTAAHFVVRSDVIFGIGCSFAIGNFSLRFPKNKHLVMITDHPETIDHNYPVERAVVGDAKLTLSAHATAVAIQPQRFGR